MDSNTENDKDDKAESKNSTAPRPRRSRRAGDVKPNERGVQIWMISFTDVMALMLTFFVLLYSMSETETKNWEELSSALQNEFNKYYGQAFDRGPVEAINLDRVDYDRALDIPYLMALLEKDIQSREDLKNVNIIQDGQSLIISMPDDLFFEPGDASIKDQGARVLYFIGGTLARIKNKIDVVGHTDPRPVNADGNYSSNWDLSLARAVNVASILNSVGYEKAIDVRGFSSARYEDLDFITDQQERQSLSRRVDIIIRNHDGRKKDAFIDF